MKTGLFVASALGALAFGAGAPTASTAQDVSTACVPSRSTEGRPSPYDSTSVTLNAGEAQVCYSRPSARGRDVFGGLVPFGQFWRTGANEPTILHITFAADVAGVRLAPGSYSVYTRPEAGEWTIYLNEAINRWGIPINASVQAEDVGHGTVPSESMDDAVEMFTIRFERMGDTEAHLVLEWETTRVRVPVAAAGS